MKMLKRLLAAAGIMTVLMAVAGCSSTRLSTSWHDTESTGESFRKPLVLALSDSQAIRTKLEDEFVRVLATNGVKGVQSYKSFPDLNESSRDNIKARLQGLGCDSVLVTHLVDEKKEQVHVPGMTTIYPAGDFTGSRKNSFGAYYDYSLKVVKTPGYSYEALTYVLETNLYNARNEKLVWSAMTETDGDIPIESAVRDFVQVVASNMMENVSFKP